MRREAKMMGCVAPALMALAGGCIHTKNEVDIKPVQVEVKPIHIVMDVNIRIDRQLDQFFAFEDEVKKPATKPAGPGARANEGGENIGAMAQNEVTR